MAVVSCWWCGWMRARAPGPDMAALLPLKIRTHEIDFADPEGAAHGCAAFFDEGRDALSKNPRDDDCPDLPWAQSVFFGSVSLTLIKEMNSAAQRSKRS